MRFRRAHTQVLSRDESVRQGRAVRAAHAALGSIDAVRAFLNNPHPALGARPIDLAVASDAGLAAVEGAIAAESRGAAGNAPAASEAAA